MSSWRASANRYREDATTEDDLVTVGYRDRLFTELIANAADAAGAAGITGRVSIWAGDSGTVHVANTGAPVSADGLRSLLSLRVSAKSSESHTVGRYGVGFTATAAVADRVEVRSTSASFVFDRDRTAATLTAEGIDPAARRPPLLRLAWPVAAVPSGGHDTEIVLHLCDGVAAADLLATARRQAPELLVELDGLGAITVADTTVRIERAEMPPLAEERARKGSLSAATQLLTITASSPTDCVVHRWLQAGRDTRWLIEVDEGGAVCARRSALTENVLRAPTPTDVELSMPAICITDLPLTPDRRHLHPDADISSAAQGYAELLHALPLSDRPALIPIAAHARNRDDAALGHAVVENLSEREWLPGAAGNDLVPSRSVVFGDLTPELAEVLAPLMADLAHPDMSERRHLARLQSVGVTVIGLAELAERLVGTERDPSWWCDLYAALSPLVTTAADAEELGALPIPRSDERLGIGARGLFLADGIDTAMSWLPTVHTRARHPLIERLGARTVAVAEAVADPALQQLVEQADDDELGRVADEVLALLCADADAAVPKWLAGLPLPDAQGELRAADELLLPDSPLAAVLVDDAPFGQVSPDLVGRVGGDVLRRIGVGWGFLTLVDELPVAPDHDLPDEERWWSTLDAPPDTLAAVRDLDLVDDGCWDEALTLLAADSTTAVMLDDPSGYTAWWLRHHAVIGGHRLGWYRAPSDLSMVGVRDVLDHPHADALGAALGGIEIESADDADTVLTHLGDPDRRIAPGIAAAVHAAVVRAVRIGVCDAAELAVPQRVRAASGEAVTDAVVLDRPWMVQVFGSGELVLAGVRPDRDDAAALAEILDLPMVDDEVRAEVVGEGVAATRDCPEATLFAVQWGHDIGRADVRLHEELWVRLWRNGDRRDKRVGWWVDEHGVTHLPRLSRP
ncbi:hypothetical protein GIY30_15095 [Gordonia sp. HNM0687]|uniref:ATP-binding protein n=1 Tax=Gordonia mangrovi TaxID=2665643 RepID=A0A6L7GRY0_9ACTN|nr:hypothetical protein [Gordonia mangrovi]MXP22666.1 hypothetical protein [Gordonia mangrovi]UVF76990.1 hypothetical protein NWF22_16895 [Gordonia mangrovi]